MPVRRGVLLLVLGVVAAALGVGSARAEGTDTTTTGTTTTSTTAEATYAPLPSAYLGTTCVTGDAAIAPPDDQALVLGTPASGRGPSAYPTTSPVVAFGSSAVSGSACTTTNVALTSVSLFGGFVTVNSVAAMNGRGSVSGVTINGSPVALSAGESALLGYWGQLTLGKTVGRLRAPLVVLLLRRYWNLPPGTTILVGFTASALPVHTATTQRSSEASERTSTTPIAASQRKPQPTDAATKRKHVKGHSAHPLVAKPPPDYPASAYPFLVGGGLAPAAQDNAVVSTVVQYLGVPYKWAGASPRAGFDCSGLVKYVFGKLGVSLPHYAAAQWDSPDAVPVPPDHLRAGDLVFFTGSDGTRKAPGHVGIYVGDGYLIDAPHTGSFVRIDSFDNAWYADKYVGARRIVSPSLHGRHLLHANTDRGSLPATALFLPQMTGLVFGESLPLIAAARTAARTSTAVDYGLWTGAGLAGALLLLAAGSVTYRRRRRAPAPNPSTDTSS